MELTDLTKEQRRELNPKILEMIESGKSEQEIYDFVLEKHPKLVYITTEKMTEYANACLIDNKQELEEAKIKHEKLKQQLSDINEYYEIQKQAVSEEFKLTLDEVEEINERFKFKQWAASFPAFNIIVLYWKFKRLFRKGKV
ncbi:hypothetical protein OGZ32_11070 [Lactococcus lactis]|uniref:hypothetical protein n=1 Tax=Lactococcus lactis TaxID=1358 RepID=UPI002417B759|nr:hypothetical protein [Lactococcus lactis]MDG4955872.1 hypothetical protein [Lactococcus lactis]